MTSKGEDFYAEMDCDQLLKIAQLAVAECSATTPEGQRPRFVIELSRVVVESLIRTIETLRTENADLRAEVARLRGE